MKHFKITRSQTIGKTQSQIRFDCPIGVFTVEKIRVKVAEWPGLYLYNANGVLTLDIAYRELFLKLWAIPSWNHKIPDNLKEEEK